MGNKSKPGYGPSKRSMKKRRMDNLRAIREDRTVGYADDVETGNSVSGSSPEPPDAEKNEEE